MRYQFKWIDKLNQYSIANFFHEKLLIKIFIIMFMILYAVGMIIWVLYGFALAWAIGDSGGHKSIIQELIQQTHYGRISTAFVIFYVVYSCLIFLCFAIAIGCLIYGIYKKIVNR